MSDQSIRRKKWRAQLKSEKKRQRQDRTEHCLRCGYKRKHHMEGHGYGIGDGPWPLSRQFKACRAFIGTPDPDPQRVPSEWFEELDQMSASEDE